MRKLLIVLVFVSFVVLPSQADARDAVTISVGTGAAYTDGNVETFDLVVPERSVEAMPLQVGDEIFFEVLEPLVNGKGTITNIYDTENPAIKEAVILDHIPYE